MSKPSASPSPLRNPSRHAQASPVAGWVARTAWRARKRAGPTEGPTPENWPASCLHRDVSRRIQSPRVPSRWSVLIAAAPSAALIFSGFFVRCVKTAGRVWRGTAKNFTRVPFARGVSVNVPTCRIPSLLRNPLTPYSGLPCGRRGGLGGVTARYEGQTDEGPTPENWPASCLHRDVSQRIQGPWVPPREAPASARLMSI